MLRLLIEIPNFAGLGRRVIMSSRDPSRESIDASGGREGPEGADFIAVQWPVRQELPNQTVRDDFERVTLIGVDVARLSPAERDRVRSALDGLRPAIAAIVDSFDPVLLSHSHAAESPTLAEWLNRPDFNSLPLLIPPQSAPPSGDARRPSRKRRLLVVAVPIVAIAAIAFIFTRTPRPVPPTPPQPRVTLDKRLTAVAHSLNCTADELRRWICDARQITEPETDRIVEEPTLRVLEDSNLVDRLFAFSDDTPETSQLREFITSLQPATALDSIRIRKALFEAHRHLTGMHAAASNTRACGDWEATTMAGEEQLDPDAIEFYHFLIDCTKEEPRRCTRQHGISTPFFDADDQCRFEDLARLFTPNRQKILGAMMGIRYNSHKRSEALAQAASTSPRSVEDFEKSYAIAKELFWRTKCEGLQNLYKEFQQMCIALRQLTRDASLSASGSL